MESPDEDDDLKLVKASASLLEDLERALPKLLWKSSGTKLTGDRVHRLVKQRDLDYILKLIEPFQGEPQLLDARLKHILPPIVEAYLAYLRPNSTTPTQGHLSLETAVCIVLYTLCKVRGYRVIVGFLNNEPRHLEPILSRLENVVSTKNEEAVEWQVPYILLLWLSHLLLTPFDLASISDTRKDEPDVLHGALELQDELPPIAERGLVVGLRYLPVSTKAQDAAAMLLVRLVSRPDMQKLKLADVIVSRTLQPLQNPTSDTFVTIYETLGSLRFLAGIASTADLSHLAPDIYRACEKFFSDDESTIASNAVAKKTVVKILRNIAILSLRSASAAGPLTEFLESTSVLEDVIDYLLRSLGDRDTPVRYAAAKALSLVILELDPDMGHQVVQAILDTFKEDMPQDGEKPDFRTASPLKWHGLTLALAHVLFKRSASPQQLSDIVTALASALQFEQRTATGSSMGTNVRDAANFGIWSLSRRYTTDELLSVNTTDLEVVGSNHQQQTVIQWLAIQLIFSACLDPAGNIRRGSSAALQELIGRHPNQVHEGIALVQIVDYQAVGLRRRAMLDVANRAAQLHDIYWNAVREAMFEWRGLGSSDVLSREAAAASLAELSLSQHDSKGLVLLQTMRRLRTCAPSDVESLQGLVLTLAYLLDGPSSGIDKHRITTGDIRPLEDVEVAGTLDILLTATKDFSTRVLHSELPSAIVKLLSSISQRLLARTSDNSIVDRAILDRTDQLTERLLTRHEDAVQQAVPNLARSLLILKRHLGAPLGYIGAQNLCKAVASDGSKSILNGASRAITLGALAALYGDGLVGDKALTAVTTLGELTHAMNVDWRITGVKGLQLSIESISSRSEIEPKVFQIMVDAVHRALNDYTIDERGDVGSLVRLQAIACTSTIFAKCALAVTGDILRILRADILRLSLEKLDRVRLAAAQCRREHLNLQASTTDVASVSSRADFDASLAPLRTVVPSWIHQALLEGCISCSGISAEPLLQASRAALVRALCIVGVEHLQLLMSLFSSILKSLVLENGNAHPALELLSFLLEMQIPQRLAATDFKWRNLLSTVQKSHHKSNDIPKILAAVQVYRGLADVSSLRDEAVKKLISMLKTNPYPRVRSSVAETLFVVTQEPALKSIDWMRPASQHKSVIAWIEERYLKS